MNKSFLKKITSLALASTILLTPISSHAALLKVGSRGTEVQQVQLALKDLGYFTYKTATGYYGSITKDAVIRFQKDNGLLVDGIVGNQTRSALFSDENVSASKSELSGALDWWTQVQYIFPREGEALVTDVDTGKSFHLRRTFGTNHADVEPLTKNDTNIIKEIWGGWSWERRAVVVTIGEQKIAGSMTAMPHAGVDAAPAVQVVNNRSYGYGRGQNLDSVKNNGIDGHMDIHFLNSRTHGTNVMQESHQSMVRKAARYIASLEK